MADFCTCGSLKIGGNCSNKRCESHKRETVQHATYEQCEFIRSLREQLNDDSELDYNKLSKYNASRLIEKLLEWKETGE